MSEIVIVDEGLLLIVSLCWRRRKAMSPVPPAMSSIFQGVGPPSLLEVEEEPGLSERTKWSFHNLCIPKDMKSFIVSYEDATLLKTPATLASFSFSGTVSNPKCVVLSWLVGCDGDSAFWTEEVKHRCE